MSFKTGLKVAPIRGSNFRKLLAPLLYITPGGTQIAAPTNFETNYASIPKVIRWWIDQDDPIIREGAVIHDFLYWKNCPPRILGFLMLEFHREKVLGFLGQEFPQSKTLSSEDMDFCGEKVLSFIHIEYYPEKVLTFFSEEELACMLRKIADKLLFFMMRELGSGRFKAHTAYWSVRLVGASHWDTTEECRCLAG